MVVVESASDDLFVKEDAMIFAIPILIAVALFMGWVLVRLTIHALPLFAGASAAFFVHQLGAGFAAAAIIGGLVALAVVTLGRICSVQAGSHAIRILVAVAFTAPAAFAAYHAALGLAAPVLGSGAARGALGTVAAVLVGSAAWRGVVSQRSGARTA